MYGTRFARCAFALLLGLLTLGGARVASAIDVELPGERKLEIHGFYEARLLFTGEDWPANGTTFTQLRHVVSLETEIELFPDGFGPFDFMFMFTRWIVSYECAYERMCGTFKSADSFGGDRRTPNRLPRHLKQAEGSPTYIGGFRQIEVLPQLTDRGEQHLNPSRRYRTCINDAGQFANPFPLAVFCNLNNRFPTDAPTRGSETRLNLRMHAGAFGVNQSFTLLRAARARLGDQRFQELQTALASGTAGALSTRELTRARTAEAFAKRGLSTAGLNPVPDKVFDLDAQRELLGTRPDSNRYETIASQLAPELLASLWGSNQIGSIIVPYLASIDTPIRPQGYFTGVESGVDIVSEFDVGLAGDIKSTIIPEGSGTNPAPGTVNSVFGSDNPFADQIQFVNNSIPFFIGADGIRNTPDDLPFIKSGSGLTRRAKGAGTAFSSNFFSEVVTATAADGSEIELYGIYDDLIINRIACIETTGVPDPQCGLSRTQAVEIACNAQQFNNRGNTAPSSDEAVQSIGVNADGDCIQLNITADGRGDVRVLDFLDSRFRPDEAQLEPVDLTDIVARATTGGRSLPARPRAPDDGLYFSTPGRDRLISKSSHIVSNLDLDFTEDELRWDHGASQDEHEFKEGYLEFEMFDSQLFARVGKLLMVWGKTELFRNQDRLNPVDIGNGLFAPLDEQRIGQWGTSITLAPEMWMRVGPIEDMRIEFAFLVDDFEPTDLGKCGEAGALSLVCLKSFGAMAPGLSGIGIIGEVRPYEEYGNWLKRMDVGVRIEGRLDRFTFALTDFWGWDDGFYIDVVHVFDRTNDPVTGAPLVSGGSSCNYRTAAGTGTNDRSQSVGPNGVLGDDDDAIPTWGDCLLWGDPDAAGQQRLRAEGSIAQSHAVNQTLFHTLCTLTFDPDQGFCAFDRLNNPREFPLISAAFAGAGLVTTLGFGFTENNRVADPASLAPAFAAQEARLAQIPGEIAAIDAQLAALPANDPQRGDLIVRRADLVREQSKINAYRPNIRRTEDGVAVPAGTFNITGEAPGFLAVNNTNNLGTDIFLGSTRTNLNQTAIANDALHSGGRGALTAAQAALLGCGPAFASPCNESERRDYEGVLARNPNGNVANGGDGTIIRALGATRATQLFGGVDLLNADASVITQEFTILKAYSPHAFVGTQRVGNTSEIEWQAGINVQNSLNASFERGRFQYQGATLSAEQALAFGDSGRNALVVNGAGNLLDGWIEPMPWQLDPFWLDQGVILYQTDPTNPFNTALRNDPLNVPDADCPAVPAGQAIPALAAQSRSVRATCDVRRWGVDTNGDGVADRIHPNATLAPYEYDGGAPDLSITNDPNGPGFDPNRPANLNRFNQIAAGDVAQAESLGLNKADPRYVSRVCDGPNGLCTAGSNIQVIDTQGAGTPEFVPLATFENDAQNRYQLVRATDSVNGRVANLVREGAVYGEYCSDTFGGTTSVTNNFTSGCSPLEALSANFERFTIGIELFGIDQAFDPPESIAELQAWLSRNEALAAEGDPIAGPDGIWARNFWANLTDDTDIQDVLAVEATTNANDADPITTRFHGPVANQTNREFFEAWDPSTCRNSSGVCHMIVSQDAAVNKVVAAAMPIAFPVQVTRVVSADPDGGNQPAPTPGSNVQINLLDMDLNRPLDLAKLLGGQTVVAGNLEVQLSDDQLQFLVGKLRTRDLTNILDLDGDGVTDLDQDGDTVYDGLDDFTPGPITDDNILCGSGLPGDLLQDSIQYEPYRKSERQGTSAFNEAIPGGLAPRSPVFCNSSAGLLGATAQTLPFKRAGGDGRFGRRDFLWHSGRQGVFRYQKRNVLGFALDFAEDITKTSWGVEFSYTSNKLFSNTLEFSGLSHSDEAVLTISVDRPTFFNFLNPNRSFFLNFQFFLRYLTDYAGGRDDRDGMFGTAEGPLDGLVTFTFFTGYFQDRLSPRLTMVWNPMTGNGAALAGLGYRWNESFSTRIGLSHFFGNTTDVQAAYFPIAPGLSSPEQILGTATGRGLTPVKNRDQVDIRVRYSF